MPDGRAGSIQTDPVMQNSGTQGRRIDWGIIYRTEVAKRLPPSVRSIPLKDPHQRIGCIRFLIRDAGLRVIQADDAKAFYEKAGFEPSPLDPGLLMISLGNLAAVS